MANEKEKAIERELENNKPAGSNKEELQDQDLDKASGGIQAYDYE
jgi:hypothetical protein